MKVTIFDQQRKVFEDRVSQVNLPGEEGECAVLDFHAPMISLLRAGRLVLDGKYLAVKRGIAMVHRNELVILVER